MSHPYGSEGPQEKDKDESEPSGHMDTEGGGSHLAEVLANNALREIIQQAKEKVSVEEGSFRIPGYVMDRLLLKCEKVLLNYGEQEALRCMVEEIRSHLAQMRDFKARENERKVKERLPSSRNEKEAEAQPQGSKAKSQRRR